MCPFYFEDFCRTPYINAFFCNCIMDSGIWSVGFNAILVFEKHLVLQHERL